MNEIEMFNHFVVYISSHGSISMATKNQQNLSKTMQHNGSKKKRRNIDHQQTISRFVIFILGNFIILCDAQYSRIY